MAYDEMTIRQIASPSVSITLLPVIALPWETPELNVRDVNGLLHDRDMPFAGPYRITLRLCLISCTQQEVNYLHQWWLTREPLAIDDEAYTAPGVSTTDAYVRTYYGRIADISDHSPEKGNWEDWTLTFDVEDIDVITVP